MLVDRGCYERGCACFDARIDKDFVLLPEKEWQGLTDEDVRSAWEEVPKSVSTTTGWIAFAQAIEAKLKEKNT